MEEQIELLVKDEATACGVWAADAGSGGLVLDFGEQDYLTSSKSTRLWVKLVLKIADTVLGVYKLYTYIQKW